MTHHEPPMPLAGVPLPGAPLAGIRVADFTRILAGPYATMMLADFGADVVKIESPLGDDTRRWVPPTDEHGDSTYFSGVNRSKRSVVCDLRTPQGLATARRLAHTADVVIENFLPRTMERFGLGDAAVRAANPGVVYCSITGFGPGSDLPGYDLLVQAVGGLMSVTGAADGPPTKAGVALVDVLTGLNAFSGILLALRARETTGLGDHLDVDLLSTLLAALTNQASSALATGIDPGRLGNAHPSIAPYELFACQDRELVIAVGNDRQFAALADELGRPDLAANERFRSNAQRVGHRDALRRELESVLRTAPAAHWKQRLDARDVPAGLVNTITEAVALAESLGAHPVQELVDDRGEVAGRQPANPIHLAGSPPRPGRTAPGLGQHADADWLPAAAPTLRHSTPDDDPGTHRQEPR
ncbi:CoA transferase [Leifsonia sp. PS1209]|uniref:CaiB/BaiF CoA transferase family protein n=1 Tax=Leifsonia sp. PS1209 TaxID=2724914 RepID=UPI001FFB78A3|nr:CoA transferase [Leifsonia sp. PS1209]